MGALFSLRIIGELCLSSLTLENAEVIAQEHNPLYLITEQHQIGASERYQEAFSHWFPLITYTAEYRQSQRSELYLDIYSTEFGLFKHGYWSSFDLKQPIFSPHLLFDLRAKGFEEEAARAHCAGSLNELLFALRQSYYAVALYENTLDVRRETVDYLSYAMEIEQRRLEAGTTIPLELNRSKAALANAISQYYTALRDLKTSRNGLILNLGIDPILEPQLSLENNRFPLFSVPEIALKLQQIEGTQFARQIAHIDTARHLLLFSELEVLNYFSHAEEQRPILRERCQEIAAAQQQVSMKQGTYLPEIGAYARFSYNDEDLGPRDFVNQPYRWVGGISLNWKLFDGLAREHEINETKSNLRAARLAYREARQRVEVEVRNSLYDLEEALFSYASAKEAVDVALQAVSDAKERLTVGRIPPLDYRDAINTLALARDQQNQASFSLMSAYYALRFSTGADITP